MGTGSRQQVRDLIPRVPTSGAWFWGWFVLHRLFFIGRAFLALVSDPFTTLSLSLSLWDKLLAKWKGKAISKMSLPPRLRWASGGKWSKNFTRWNCVCRTTGGASPARQLHKGAAPARWSTGIGTGPAWLVRCRTTAVPGNRHCRFWVGIPAGRLLSAPRVIAIPLRGFGRKLLKDTSIRWARPGANTGAGSQCDVRNRPAVGSRLPCHHRPKALCSFPLLQASKLAPLIIAKLCAPRQRSRTVSKKFSKFHLH